MANCRAMVNELFTKSGKGPPEYKEIENSGLSNDKRFRFALVVDGKEYAGEAVAKKNSAKESAAAEYLNQTNLGKKPRLCDARVEMSDSNALGGSANTNTHPLTGMYSTEHTLDQAALRDQHRPGMWSTGSGNCGVGPISGHLQHLSTHPLRRQPVHRRCAGVELKEEGEIRPMSCSASTDTQPLSGTVPDENSRQKLSQLAARKKVPQPEYVCVYEGGPAHSKRFRFRASMLGQSAEGKEAGTKDQAKESAASYLLDILHRGVHDGGETVKKKLKGHVMKLADHGALVLVDVDNVPKALQYIEEFCDAFPKHDVCQVMGYAAFSYERDLVPSYVKFKNALSLNKDAADIMMVFEVAKMLPELKGGKLDRVLIISKDHFAPRLQELLDAEGIPCEHAATREQVMDSLSKARHDRGAVGSNP